MTREKLDKLSPEELRIKVAELCGAKWRLWHSASHKSLSFDETRPLATKHYSQSIGELKYWIDELPDYLNDLNAMHKAEKLLNKEQWVIYGRNLDKLNVFPLVHATAAQRAEAFVMAMENGKE